MKFYFSTLSFLELPVRSLFRKIWRHPRPFIISEDMAPPSPSVHYFGRYGAIPVRSLFRKIYIEKKSLSVHYFKYGATISVRLLFRKVVAFLNRSLSVHYFGRYGAIPVRSLFHYFGRYGAISVRSLFRKIWIFNTSKRNKS